ncbi:MAG: hypothetical protein ACRDID_08485 [Ktedonobacterales bacterium]
MGMHEPCFVEFAVNDDDRFAALSTVFEAIKHDKDSEEFRDDADWLEFLDDAALSHFWWPTAAEYAAHTERWQAASVDQRFQDPSLTPPSWDFSSLFMAFADGEYELISCRRTAEDRARLEFDPYAYPYGGTGCMRMLIQAFEFHIVGEDDGTGYHALSEH